MKPNTNPPSGGISSGKSFFSINQFIALIAIIVIAVSLVLIVENRPSTNANGYEIKAQIKNTESTAFAALASPIVLQEGKSFELQLSSNLPNPPIKYLYDTNGDGIAETELSNGNSAIFTMEKTDPLYKVCQEVAGGETCISKIVAIDNTGNKAELSFASTTIYD